MGWKAVTVITKKRVKGKSFWKDSFKSDFKRCAWSEWLVACQRMERLGGLVWLGPTDFLVDILNLLEKYKLRLKCVLVGPEELGEKAGLRQEIFWYKLSHLNVGGVSDSVIGIGTFFKHPELCWTGQAKVRRTLGHVLKPVLFGPMFNDKK